MSNWLQVLISISVGFILLLIELFTPGFGLTGIGGLILLAVGSYIAFTKLNQFWGVVVSLGSIAIVISFFKLFLKTGFWKKIRLATQETKEMGFKSSADLEGFLNKEGLTVTNLRPTGIALIEGKRIDVIAEGIFIPRGEGIQVIRVEGNKITVKEKRR